MAIKELFKGYLLREFLSEPNLQAEFGIPTSLADLLNEFSEPTANAISMAVNWRYGTNIPPKAVEEVIRFVSKKAHVVLTFRAMADFLAFLKSSDQNYHSCCRSALCHAVVGKYEWAHGALNIAAGIQPDWARHHHVRGLILGMTEDLANAKQELSVALPAEGLADVRQRIREAIESF